MSLFSLTIFSSDSTLCTSSKCLCESKVFHNYIIILACPAKSEGLVRYPTTLSPVSGSVSVTTQCADNAHRTSSSLSVSCTSSGSWSGTTPQCQCDIGYSAVTVGGRQICKG